MAYQKEQELRPELREEIQDLLDGLGSIGDLGFLDEEESRKWPSEREYLQFKVIPELVDHMVDDPANEGMVQKLSYAKELIESDAIRLAIVDQDDVIDGAQLHPFDIYGNGRITFMILVRPNVLAGLASCEDRRELIGKFRNVFLQAADEQRRLALEEKFVPYSEVSQ